MRRGGDSGDPRDSDDAGLRFDPPALAATPALAWALAAAFGPLDGLAPPTDPGAAVAVARSLGLGPRIASRQVAAGGRDDLDADLARDRTAALARATAVAELAAPVAAAARSAGTPVVALKLAALLWTGAALPGGRYGTDLDLLADPDRADALAVALEAEGLTPAAVPAEPHHLPSLHHPSLGPVEIHRHLPGLRPAPAPPGSQGTRPRRFARLGDLEAAGALVALDEPAGWLVPDRPVLAAALVAHGIAQHGLAPRSYPLARLLGDLADLVDLAERTETADASTVPALLDAAAPWLVGTVRATELRALGDLVETLRAGDLPRPEEPAGRLLAHVVAGTFDPRYREALKLRRLTGELAEGGAMASLGRMVASALWPSVERLDALYGPPDGRLGRLGQRLRRPFDVAVKLGRALGANRFRS